MAVQLIDLTARYLHTIRKRTEEQITRIAIHHDAGVAPTKVEKVVPRFDAYHLQHDDVGGMPYTYAIDPWGNTYKCRRTTAVTAHVRNNNTHSLAVMLMGYFHHDKNFAGQVPTEAQLVAMEALVKELAANIPSITDLTPHKLVPGSKTACPGNLFPYARLDALRKRCKLTCN